ncbi:amino acid ABC transporter permease [Bosea sp. SSUT16]|jgi:polar amino acid transport system permease protein|uniref:Amino acid ABC transporter permease n=1 Tax=Bosea spartocytisi TaxID=2773451 RepID=A0A927ECI4_9HYPH|nr:amino acid ABC transporter permease [Bosea spartocytisi]MBD3848304.1 amino acid ABC transporter permease [Bosea spartocytisi]MCT4474771.1 amino acid ABC transporter permease [Bosea spartocytisi]
MTLDFSVVADAWKSLLFGALGTLFLAFSGMVIAMVVGVMGVVILRMQMRIPSLLVTLFVEIIRNTPFLVQIFFLFFALPLAGVRLNPTITAILALGLNGGAYAIEIIRGGVESIPKGQTEAGLALGLHKHEVFRLIVLIPALRAIYPSLASQFILLTLTTAICTSISAYELTSVGQRIEAETFRSFEVYFTLTSIYLVISLVTMWLLAALGRWAFSYPQR